MASASKIDVPWSDAHREHRLRLVLLDEEAQPLMVVILDNSYALKCLTFPLILSILDQD